MQSPHLTREDDPLTADYFEKMAGIVKTKQAALYKAIKKLPYADSFVAAMTMILG